MLIIKSIQNFIDEHTKIKRDDYIVDVLPNSRYHVEGNIASGFLTLLVAFNERSDDASGYAQLIYKWAETQGYALRDDIKFEALRISHDTFDYYFTFDWLDKVNVGEMGQKAMASPVPDSLTAGSPAFDSIVLNDIEFTHPASDDD
ncbi:MAG: hypothetical protein COA90_00910 [Gammaproteobacteria bacterium]|nr:MAG: hypothetical protein COA90_00910 [Gammaproteobacteria bacterium]